MNLILSYEASALAAPQSFRDAMQTAANILDATIQDNITVTIQVGYGDWDNNQITGLGTSAVGGDLYGGLVSYTNLRAALASHETSTLDQTFVNSLPTTTSVNGVSSFYVPSAVEKALGMISPTASAIDGAVGIGASIPTADLVGVALHEFTHAFGREPGAGTFDLGRYTSAGNHLFSSGSTAPAAYFSIDGGITKLADYGQNSDPSDFLNSGVQGSTDPFNEFYSGSTSQQLSIVDKEVLELPRLQRHSERVRYALGGDLEPCCQFADGNGRRHLDHDADRDGEGRQRQCGGRHCGDAVGQRVGQQLWRHLRDDRCQRRVHDHAGLDAGAERDHHGYRRCVQEHTSVSFVAGAASATTSSLVASSPTVTADGTSTTTLTVTVHDAHGNAVAGTAVTLSGSGSSNSFGAISGTTNANGVFTTTLASTLAQNETITATEGSVHEQASVSFVAGAASATTSSLVASSPTVTADGTSTTTLTVTVHDAHGNAVAGTAVTLSGSGSANSFGAISGTTNANGVFTTTLASTLVQNETITATEGTVHEQASVSFVAGAASATTSSLVASSPTVTADGTSTTTLTVTVHDAHGNAVAGTAVTLSGSGSSNSFGAISGTTNANGVFTTTLASTLVQNETITATEGSVHEQASVSFVAGAASATTSSLVASSPTVTADGTSTTTLTVTVHDAHGNAVAGTAVTLSGSGSSNTFGAISGTTNANGVFTTTLASTLAQNETITATEGSVQEHTSVSFVAGAASATTSSLVASSPTVAADGTSTTTLTVTVEDAHGNAVAGTAVTLSGSGSNNTFGAISGTTNANGVFTTTLASTLVQNETITATEGSVQEHTSVSFVSPVIAGTVIEAVGSTSLVQVGSNYFMYTARIGSRTATIPAHLSWSASLAAGLRSARNRRRSGYDVAWKMAGADQYTVWSTDSSGNYVSTSVNGVSGSSTALESIETTFHQDLNGDGVIGLPPPPPPPPPTVIEAVGSTSLDRGRQQLFLYPCSGSGPELKRYRRACRGRPIWRLDADRCGADFAAATTWPGRWLAPINTRCGAPTAAATISATSLNGVSGTSTRAGIDRDHLPPGPQRRRRDRPASASSATSADGDRGGWLDQPGPRSAAIIP